MEAEEGLAGRAYSYQAQRPTLKADPAGLGVDAVGAMWYSRDQVC